MTPLASLFRLQQGTALLMSLIMLLVLSLLAISGMQGSLLQERMAAAQREGTIALEIAESGARDAERWIEENLVTLNDFDGSSWRYDAGAENTRAPSPFTDNFWQDTNRTRAGTPVGGITPRYFIEYRGRAFEEEQLTDGMIGGYSHDTGAGSAFAFRTVAWAPGPSGVGQRIIEVYYNRQL
ncbi:MAG: hypothetical protein EA349_09480 [Halomonadaceae bacterium]|nr:MAG: hypothetical protein EA349_09480 [Halomonadaceae bacterium]